MERSHGEEGIEGKCRKDKGHDLWCQAWTACRVQANDTCAHLLYRSKQQQHLLQWLQTLGA